MPAAAVIPAPIAYIKVVAVKKLVVGSASIKTGSPLGFTGSCGLLTSFSMVLLTECLGRLVLLL